MRFRLAVAALAAWFLPTAAHAQAPALAWGPAPAVFPAGAKLAVLQGDPSKDALYPVRLDMPSGYKIPPHFHPTVEHVTVISGTFLVGMGDSLDAAHTTAFYRRARSSLRGRTCIITPSRADAPWCRCTASVRAS